MLRVEVQQGKGGGWGYTGREGAKDEPGLGNSERDFEQGKPMG